MFPKLASLQFVAAANLAITVIKISGARCMIERLIDNLVLCNDPAFSSLPTAFLQSSEVSADNDVDGQINSTREEG